MTPPIQPPAGPGGVPAATAVRRAAASGQRVGSGGSGADVLPVSLDTTPSAPPATVLEQMHTAAASLERLQAQGLEVRFAEGSGGHRASAGLYDRTGALVRELSAREALDLAAGGAPLEEVLG